MHPILWLNTRFVLLAFSSLLSVNGIANANSLETQKKALDVIADFADRLCTTIPLTGSTSNIELSGKAKAELSELIKKIANLGIEGAAKYQTSEWQGVLQQDLTGQVNNSRNCKVEVFKDLKDRLLAPVDKESKITTCTIEAKVTSDVVSRVFFRDAFRPEGGEQTLQPMSQELFYEWKVLLSANESARDISLELHQLQAGDRISIHPPSAGVLSEPSKRWYSGFPEPHRSKPDYLLRTVRFSHLSPHIPTAAVTIRRFLSKPLLSSNNLIKIENATASNCQIQLGNVGQAQEAERLQGLAKALAENVFQMSGIGSPVPIRDDPGDLKEHETQATIEVRCKDESCGNMEARQLEARLGKSPYEYAKELQTEQLQRLKKDLETVLGCVEGPQADPHPARDSQFIRLCGDPVHLSAEDMQRLLSVFQKHGVQLDIMTPKDSPGSATQVPQ
jgi:hypothetical protein